MVFQHSTLTSHFLVAAIAIEDRRPNSTSSIPIVLRGLRLEDECNANDANDTGALATPAQFEVYNSVRTIASDESRLRTQSADDATVCEIAIHNSGTCVSFCLTLI